jgi:AcrR family transcriptional regulator
MATDRAPDTTGANPPPQTTPMPAAPRLRAGDAAEKRPGRPARRRSLNQESIVDAALRIVDVEGLDALTMRRVGQELGTGGASLYAHIANKEELIELLLDRVIGELEVPGAPDPDRWREQLKDGVRALRATLGAHNDIARACLARIPLGPNALRGSEAMIGVMRAGRLPDDVVAYAVDLVALYATATAYEESIYANVAAGPDDFHRYIDEMRAYFSALPPDRFPNLVALAGPLTAGTDGDERFEFGLDVLVRGLATFAPAD